MLINKDTLLERTAKLNNERVSSVRSVHNALEKTIVNIILSSVSPENTKDNPVVIKLFEGISLKAYYEPERTMKPNYSDSEIVVAPHIKIKAEATRNYNSKITAMALNQYIQQ